MAIDDQNPKYDDFRKGVPISPGDLIAHYKVIKKLGAGGMGEVYLAEDTELNRKVALKFLPPHLCQDADCRARFKREAQAAAKLSHPNIITIFEVSEYNGRPFFAMEHIEGESLADFIRKHDNSLDKIVDLSIQICEGLNKAHQAGIIHRDIKPSNILIDRDGRAKIVDFGLAAIKGVDKLTKTGSTLGTLHYMSPEQTRGEEIDKRSDIFSFGIVLYEMITGQLPFKGDHEPAIIYSIGYEVPEPLARYKSGVPDELQRIVSKSLSKQRDQRYQHADELLADLRTYSKEKSSSIGVKPRGNVWNQYVVTAAVAVIFVIVGYWGVTEFLAKDTQKPESARKMLAVLPFENLGSPEDEYFADGITDEITGKLATIRELGVISRTSTIQYRKTSKNLRQIAKELGVDYILEGTIRWDKGGDTSRVRILPQLIRVSDDTHLWAETFQRPLTDIFALQTDIANQVVAAMDITLRGSEAVALNDMPTRNLEAYHAYLRGVDYYYTNEQSLAKSELALQMFERAVRLDSTFALAYAFLGMQQMWCYGAVDANENRLVLAKKAIDRALALQPNSPRVHQALSDYYYWGFKDYDRTLSELEYAEAGLPNDGYIIMRKAFIHARQGKSQEALAGVQRTIAMDPRSASGPAQLADLYNWLHDYELANRYYDQSISLAPDQVLIYTYKASNYYMWRGDTAAARATLADIPDQNADDTRWAWMWHHMLTRDYNAALGVLTFIRPNARSLKWSGVVYGLLDAPERARICFDSALTVAERELAQRSKDYRAYSDLGIIYAGLGRKDDAIRAGEQAVKLLPVVKDAFYGPEPVENLALIYTMVGEYDAALDQLEYLLSIPNYVLSVPLLRLDPRYDPLRKLPRYQKLVEKYGT